VSSPTSYSEPNSDWTLSGHDVGVVDDAADHSGSGDLVAEDCGPEAGAAKTWA
jgi:hypothetical protein